MAVTCCAISWLPWGSNVPRWSTAVLWYGRAPGSSRSERVEFTEKKTAKIEIKPYNVASQIMAGAQLIIRFFLKPRSPTVRGKVRIGRVGVSPVSWLPYCFVLLIIYKKIRKIRLDGRNDLWCTQTEIPREIKEVLVVGGTLDSKRNFRTRTVRVPFAPFYQFHILYQFFLLCRRSK